MRDRANTERAGGELVSSPQWQPTCEPLQAGFFSFEEV